MGGRHYWLACALGIVVMLSAFRAHADGGQLTFTGRIVESTCPADSLSISDTEQATGKIVCGARNGDDRSYDVSRIAVTGHEPDRVLRYFNDYVRAGDAMAQPTLEVRVYE